MIIIGIAGTLGSGKGTVAEYLKNKGFLHFSARGFLIKELEKRSLPVNRDSLREMAKNLRLEHGPGYIAKALCALAKESGQDSVVESIRTLAGVRTIKENGGIMLAVDADPKIRYERVLARASETDKVSFEQFMEHEEKEMHGKEAESNNIAKCIENSDYKILNNGTLEELYSLLDKILDI